MWEDDDDIDPECDITDADDYMNRATSMTEIKELNASCYVHRREDRRLLSASKINGRDQVEGCRGGKTLRQRQH